MCTYNEFVEAYNNPSLTTHDIRRKYQLNSNKYSKLRRKALNNGDIPSVRHMNNTNAKFYTKTVNGDWQVQKTINGKKTLYGVYESRNLAEKVVNACITVDWEYDKVKGLIDLLSVKPKNYSCINGYWIIQKYIKGKNVVFNTFSADLVDESLIIGAVEFYRSVGWDIDYRNYVKSNVLKGVNIS